MTKWVLNGSCTSTWMSKNVLKKIPAIRGKADYLEKVNRGTNWDDYMGQIYFGEFFSNPIKETEPRTKGIYDKLITSYKTFDARF